MIPKPMKVVPHWAQLFVLHIHAGQGWQCQDAGAAAAAATAAGREGEAYMDTEVSKPCGSTQTALDNTIGTGVIT